MKKDTFIYRNGLSIVIFVIFVLFLIGQAVTGWHEYNKEMEDKHGMTLDLPQYISSAHFLEATFENWESEFLQMGMYVLFTIFLRQKGSSESKPLDEKAEVDRQPQPKADAPWPVRKGGLWLALYRNSLSLAFLFLFLVSFIIHAVSSHREYNKEQVYEGENPVPFGEFLCNSRLWFESFQNWQSEFIAVFSIVVLSVFLRQYGSPESKPVDAPDDETGTG
jgi:hypothetical protein